MNRRKKTLLIAATAFAGVAAAIGGLTQSSSAKGKQRAMSESTGTAAVVPAFVPDVVRRVVSIAGDPSPTSARFVLTTRQAAVGLQGERVDSDQPVYFVVVRGSFVYKYARGFGPPPEGTVLTLTVDAATGDSLDLALGNDDVNLSALGQVHPLDLSN